MTLDLVSFLALRPDIATGHISRDQFAASLDEVIKGGGADVYRDPKLFFESSHPSDGMRQLLEIGLGRLTGTKPDANSMVRLETTLGGGKTHLLIGLYHAARGGLPLSRAKDFVDPKYLPKAPVEAIATIIGERVGATSFSERDGIKPQTLWGSLILQLGGRASYETIRDKDESKEILGADDLVKLIGDRPTLIMIDEIGLYLRAASAVTIGASDLGKQTTAFLFVLMSAIKSCPRAFLAITTTETTDVFGSEVNDLLKETRDTMARTELAIPPNSISDLPAILRRRLFLKEPDPKLVDAVAEAYVLAAADAAKAGATLTSEATAPHWRACLQKSYPFHPTLIDVFDERLATMPGFQLTRGALRLLSVGLQRYWATRTPATSGSLFHLSDFDLSDPEILGDVTSRIGRENYSAVIKPISLLQTAKHTRSRSTQRVAIIMRSGLRKPYISGL